MEVTIMIRVLGQFSFLEVFTALEMKNVWPAVKIVILQIPVIIFGIKAYFALRQVGYKQALYIIISSGMNMLIVSVDDLGSIVMSMHPELVQM